MPTEGFPRGKVVVEGGGRVSKRDRKGDEDQLFKSTKRVSFVSYLTDTDRE